MRLLNVTDHSFRDFYGINIPPYLIASHRWTDDEITFKDVLKNRNKSSAGWRKIEGFCERAKRDNELLKSFENATLCEWTWIDTCCIDKRSSAEVSESINSMFTWYREAQECHAYLADVKPFPKQSQQLSDVLDDFRHSEWWKRGWTLQELLAPRTVVFFTQTWQVIGHKCADCNAQQSCEGAGPLLNTIIAEITGIPEEILRDYERSKALSVEEKMKWQMGRRTTRIEDRAYCLLGLFDVHMPLLYGEGEKAMLRLERTVFEELERPWRSQLRLNFNELVPGVRHRKSKWLRSGRPLTIMRHSDVEGEVLCICGYADDDGWLVACDVCQYWQHAICYYPEKDGQPGLSANQEHRCRQCSPRVLDVTAARRHQQWKRMSKEDPGVDSPSFSNGTAKRRASDTNSNDGNEQSVIAKRHQAQKGGRRVSQISSPDAPRNDNEPQPAKGASSDSRPVVATQADPTPNQTRMQSTAQTPSPLSSTPLSPAVRGPPSDIYAGGTGGREGEKLDAPRNLRPSTPQAVESTTPPGEPEHIDGVIAPPTASFLPSDELPTYPPHRNLLNAPISIRQLQHATFADPPYTDAVLHEPPPYASSWHLPSNDSLWDSVFLPSTSATATSSSAAELPIYRPDATYDGLFSPFQDEWNQWDQFTDPALSMPLIDYAPNLDSQPSAFEHAWTPSEFNAPATSRPAYGSAARSNARAPIVVVAGSSSTRRSGRCPHEGCGLDVDDLDVHLHRHRIARPEKCPVPTCEYNTVGFARKYDKDRHVLTHYKGELICPFCAITDEKAAKTFNRADVFKRHLTSVHGVEQVPPNARRVDRSSSSIYNKASGSSKSTEGSCSLCSQTFADPQAFYEHLDHCVLRMVDHQNDVKHDSYTCQHTECAAAGVAFRFARDLRRHMRSKHGEGEVQLYACPECEWTSSRRDNLHRHLRNHHGAEIKRRG